MRRWHHQLTHLNIHKDWSRNVFRKNVKFQNVTTSLFLIRFSSFLHQSVGKFFTLSFEIMVILDWTSPLTQTCCHLWNYLQKHDTESCSFKHFFLSMSVLFWCVCLGLWVYSIGFQNKNWYSRSALKMLFICNILHNLININFVYMPFRIPFWFNLKDPCHSNACWLLLYISHNINISIHWASKEKLITSSKRHTLKLIIIGHRIAIIILKLKL